MKRPLLARLVCSLVATVCLVGTTPARAQDPRKEAERAFTAGDQAYEAGQYLAAARAYENAYALYPSPSITFSIAQAYRRHYFESQEVDVLKKAQSLYQRYLDEQPTGGRRAHAITHLGNIAVLLAERANEVRPGSETRGQPTELLISSPTPGATASIDGAPFERVPLVETVIPGPHRVTVSSDGFVDAEIDVVAIEGKMIIVPSALDARPGRLRVIADEGAYVWIDGRLVGRAPLTSATELPAGPHAVSIGADGRASIARTVTIERAKEETLRVQLDTSSQRIAAQWTWIGAGAFAVAGGALGIVSLLAESDAKDARAGNDRGRALTPAEASDSNNALARRDVTRDAALVSFGVAGAAGIAGTILFVFDSPSPQAAPKTGAAAPLHTGF